MAAVGAIHCRCGGGTLGLLLLVLLLVVLLVVLLVLLLVVAASAESLSELPQGPSRRLHTHTSPRRQAFVTGAAATIPSCWCSGGACVLGW
jgi:hypothetical protein